MHDVAWHQTPASTGQLESNTPGGALQVKLTIFGSPAKPATACLREGQFSHCALIVMALQDPAGSIDPGESGADTTTDAVTPSNTSSSGGVRRKPQQVLYSVQRHQARRMGKTHTFCPQVFSASRLQEEKFQPGESALRSR